MNVLSRSRLTDKVWSGAHFSNSVSRMVALSSVVRLGMVVMGGSWVVMVDVELCNWIDR